MTRTSPQWTGDTESKPAPGELRRVQAFINTIDLESGADRLAVAEDARPWLIDNDLLAQAAVPSTDDLSLLVSVRAALRAMVIHSTGGPVPDPAALRDVADAGVVRAVLDDHGRVALVAAGDSVRERLMALVLIVRDAQLDGSWSQLKACANDDCRWAFYDHSRNHGGTWCDMATCGNKLKNRDFRARKRAEPT